MEPRLVFVHGIGGARHVDRERIRWAGALADGARQAGHSTLASRLVSGTTDVAFAYYGDLFGLHGTQGVDAADLDEDTARLLTDLLSEVVESRLAETEDERVRRELMHASAQLHPSGQAQGAGDLVRLALNAATTLVGARPMRGAAQWVSGRHLLGDLAQVARYLARREADACGVPIDVRIRERVSQALGSESAVVVAHSLGTVVALEALYSYQGEIPLFVTLGSPIAMRAVVWPRLVPCPPCAPEAVRCWLNFWDRDDIITARPRLEDHVLASSSGVRPESRRVDSDGLWVHDATKYLATPGVAGPISEALGRRESRDPV
jgi:pimeloyl-ACP methyl ester carboxylesterase